MKKFALVFLLFLCACSQKNNKHVIDSTEKNQYLFVISSHAGSLKENLLTLEPVPLVVYFSDRPHRVAGHSDLKEFIAKWDKGINTYKTDPPNATLSISEKGKMKDAIIELMDPELKDDKLQFKVNILKNGIPQSFGPNSLFLDLYVDTAIITGG